ncbi:glutamyl endopeptidase, partial [Pseudoalteromonas sp. S408]
FNFSRIDQKRYADIEIKHVISGSVLNLNNLPQGEIRDVQWSANSRFLSFVLEQVNSATLWVFDVQRRRLEQVTQSTLNGFLTTSPYQWLP